jgi:hypothetical protein
MRFVVVFSSALEGCRVAGCFGIDITVGVADSVGHFLVGAIVFDHRRRTSLLGVSIDWWCLGRGGGIWRDLLPSDLRGWPLWPFLKGIAAAGLTMRRLAG